MHRNKVLFVTLALLSSLSVFSQTKRFSGKVTSPEKGPIPGVTVQIKNTKIATATTEDGSFVLTASGDDRVTLVFSSIGFEPKEVAATTGVPLNVELKDDTRNLSDVVVVGYGSVKKTDLTGSVTSLKADKLKEIPAVSIEQAIQGRMAGVQVQQTSGQPGAGISIRIRGVSSIAGGNEPLYVIDGLPQFNDDVRGANGLSTINPSDIESIEVLKDAAATAIYGSRGANGVVMVTTKSGKVGQPRITFESSLGFQTIRKKLEMMNSQEYIDYSKAFYTNTGLPIPTDLANASAAINTDWQDEVFRTGALSNSSLSIGGGTERNRYFISAGYTNQQGIVMNSGYKRANVRVNVDSKISDRFSVQSRIMASRAIQDGFSPSVGDNIRNFGKSGVGSILRSITTVGVYNPDGSYTDTSPFSFNGIDVENPVAVAKEVLDRNTTTRVQGGLDFKAQILKGLSNTTRVSADFYHIRRDLYFPRLLPRLGNAIGSAELGLYDKTSVLAEDFLEYKYDISHDTYLEAIAGVSFQRDRFNSVDLAASGFGSDALKNYNFSSANTVSKPLTDVTESTIISGFARVRLNLKNKYLLAASIRRDGASVFAENNKYGVFPSVSAAWRVSEEDFLKESKWLSNLKLRASWGQAGNPAIKPYQSLLLGRTVNTGQGAGTGQAVGLAPTFPNPNLKWETTSQTNIGLDAGFLNEKFRLTFDYYVKTTTDLLALVQLPPSAGVGAGIGSGPGQILDNVGEVQNKGWELTLGANIVNTADWGFSVDVNLSQNKNKVTKTKDGKDIPTIAGGNDASGSNSIIRVGEPLSAFLGPKYLGMDKNGVPIHENLNGDKDANGVDIINALDNQIIGSPYPDLYYGINPSIRYKKLTLTSVWAGVSGSKINNFALFELAGPNVVQQYNKMKAASEFYPKPSLAASNQHFRSSRYMEDGSFFRMRNIRLDYSFNLGNSKTVKNLNVYASGQNLITFTNYSGFDPEVNTFNGNDRRQGVDLGSYPAAKTVTLGFSITF
ncbi:SusC/RagA family TonB-linked outer membrane protein [Chitinophaga niabensis]|uniref:TonB-linked outer membrane protein, SusC/RagA family n=1 Tax=Chitinophaga niabensis TaxID=536979 RepID=A0A1N6JNT2_9BACT|nr:TonB-dependent receptor [Chitinophaga niabensis]SIO45960.1 TonB-linked outer membrane protein, SusC/RagA family [Chitinophaga niabensis]